MSELVQEVIQKYFPDDVYLKAAERIRSHLRRTSEYKQRSQDEPVKDIKQSVIDMLRKGATSDEISDNLGTSEGLANALVKELKQEGYNITNAGDKIVIINQVIPTNNTVQEKWNGDKIIRFGLMGDTQINSKYTQLTHLHKLYDFYEQEGIETVYHTGDIDEGEQMRKGHQYECYNQGVDAHAEEIVRVYPRRKNIRTRYITGNHDASMIRLAGVDIGRMIESKRDDMEYLGQDNAVIYLTENCTLELRHPWDGTAYALSYKIQKTIESMSGGEKPNILAVGHYHKQEQIFYRNVHAFQTACLQAQTPFMRGKGIAAAVGGWIIEVFLNCDGSVERIKTEFLPFYRAIKDDYKNFQSR